MKLIYVAIAYSAALLADAQSSLHGECTNARSFKGVIKQGRHVTAEQYDANFDANLYKYLQAKAQNGSPNEICSEKAEECAALLDHLDLESFRDKTGGSRQCGQAADHLIDTMLGCALCERLGELTEADEYCASDSNSMACVSRSTTQSNCPGSGNTQNTLFGCYDVKAEEIDNQSTTTQEEDEEEDDGSLSEEGTRKTSSKIKIFFSRCTGKVWNIVVSGGPEYCKDMFPKYPRVIHGKMRPGHPNYEMVVEIRDSCLALQNIVKQTRCFCLYVLWGCSEYPRACGGQHKQRAASKREGVICYYFSNLKGTGVYKPRTRPVDTQCGKRNPGVNVAVNNKPKTPNVTSISVKEQAKRKCKGKKRKKKMYNKCIKTFIANH